MKKSNIIVACLCTVTLVAVSFSSGYAAGNNATYKSQGVLRFDNNTADTADDVIFNANDFSSIDAVVTNGKLDVANALNSHTDSEIATTVIPTFNTLTDAINTIANNGAFNRTLSVSQESVNIPRGFHNGAGKISIALEQQTIAPSVSTQVVEPSTGKVLSSVTVQGSPNLKAENIKSGVEIFGTTGSYTDDATVDENKILASYTAYARGSKITGKIPSLAAKTWMPGTISQTISAGSYLSGDQIIAGDANLVPANIADGISIFGVDGTAVLEKNANAHNVPTGKTIAGTSDALTGKTFWDGSSWQNGSMVSKADTTVAATTVAESGSNALITIPTAGYYDTNSKLQVPVETIKNQVSTLGGTKMPMILSGNSQIVVPEDCKNAIVIGWGRNDSGGAPRATVTTSAGTLTLLKSTSAAYKGLSIINIYRLENAPQNTVLAINNGWYKYDVHLIYGDFVNNLTFSSISNSASITNDCNYMLAISYSSDDEGPCWSDCSLGSETAYLRNQRINRSCSPYYGSILISSVISLKASDTISFSQSLPGNANGSIYLTLFIS